MKLLIGHGTILVPNSRFMLLNAICCRKIVKFLKERLGDQPDLSYERIGRTSSSMYI
jgi:hypothetical protein